MRYGPLAGATVLRPLAEHVADVVGARAGETCVDVPGDGGTLAVALARRVGMHGRVIAVDGDADARDACAAHARSVRAAVEVRAEAPVGCAERATSLAILAGAQWERALDGAVRALRPGGRLAVLTWAPAGAPHEAALGAAVGNPGMSVPPLEDVAAAARAHRGLRAVETVMAPDVLRFDGVGHLWATLVDGRPAVRAEVGVTHAPRREAALAVLRDRLAFCTARDGTLAVPVVAAVVAASAVGETAAQAVAAGGVSR